MTQQYGLRASRNLGDIENRDACLDNLGIDRRDFSILVGTSAAGVDESDYQNCIGLQSSLETQITTLAPLPGQKLTALTPKIRTTGDTISGSLGGATLNNDRAYVDTSFRIYGSSTSSYFSPLQAPDFSAGAQYKAGTVAFPAGLTVTGLNLQGKPLDWSNYFVRYPRYLQMRDNSNTLRYAPLYLAPPTALTTNVLWLDSEYSKFSFGATTTIREWSDVVNRGVATQSSAGNSPLLAYDDLNGRAGVQFDGINDSLSLSFNTTLLSSEATLIAVFSLSTPSNPGDTAYSILSSVNNSNSSWSGSWGLFTSSLVADFPKSPPVNGTHVVSIRISNSYGLEYRLNGVRHDYTAKFTFAGSGTYVIGGPIPFIGTLYALAIYNSVLDDRQLRSQEQYFRWRFGFGEPNPDADTLSYTQAVHDEQQDYLQLEDGSVLVPYGGSADISYVPITELLEDEGGALFTLENGTVLEVT